jgi:hypothetical protein
MSINTIFGAKTSALKPRYEKEKKTEPKPRKERKDKKNDIKAYMSLEDYKFLKRQARDHKMSLTAHCSLIVKSELTNETYFDECQYEKGEKLIHVTLEKDYLEIFDHISLEKWNGLSRRKTAYRILKNYVSRFSHGRYRIINYNER